MPSGKLWLLSTQEKTTRVNLFLDLLKLILSMYLQYSKNLEINIAQQIEELNAHVLQYCINNIFNEAVAYLKYKEDASTMHRPMQHPIYSNKTNKTLEQKPWF